MLTTSASFFVLLWASHADRLDATSFALGSGRFDLSCETGTSNKDLDPGVTFAAGWDIGTVASPLEMHRTPAPEHFSRMLVGSGLRRLSRAPRAVPRHLPVCASLVLNDFFRWKDVPDNATTD